MGSLIFLLTLGVYAYDGWVGDVSDVCILWVKFLNVNKVFFVSGCLSYVYGACMSFCPSVHLSRWLSCSVPKAPDTLNRFCAGTVSANPRTRRWQKSTAQSRNQARNNCACNSRNNSACNNMWCVEGQSRAQGEHKQIQRWSEIECIIHIETTSKCENLSPFMWISFSFSLSPSLALFLFSLSSFLHTHTHTQTHTHTREQLCKPVLRTPKGHAFSVSFDPDIDLQSEKMLAYMWPC